jgi:hypothetical protein
MVHPIYISTHSGLLRTIPGEIGVERGSLAGSLWHLTCSLRQLAYSERTQRRLYSTVNRKQLGLSYVFFYYIFFLYSSKLESLLSEIDVRCSFSASVIFMRGL